jgi:ubiquinone/menaquinone biosynthesis C-methylase UbiE
MATKDENATAEGYDRWAASYDDSDPSTWLDEPFLLTHLRPFAGCRILDLGCGTGRYLRRLTSSCYGMVGVDLSRNMLARTRRGLANETEVCLVQASATSLPFRPASFDRIMSGLVIDHVASAERLFHEVAAVLRSGGNAVIASVHPEMQRITGSDIEISPNDTLRIPGHVHEVDGLLAAVRNAGLAITAIEEPPVTAAMVAHRPQWKRKVGRPALLLLALAKHTVPDDR